MADRQEPVSGWAPTWALGRAVLLTGLLLIAAVLLGRIELVVLATPFALGTAYGLRRRPTTLPELELGTPDAHLVEGSPMAATIAVVNPDGVPYDLAVVRTRMSRWLRVEQVGFGGTGVDVSRSGGAGRPFVTSVPGAGAPEHLQSIVVRHRQTRWARGRVPTRGNAGTR